MKSLPNSQTPKFPNSQTPKHLNEGVKNQCFYLKSFVGVLFFMLFSMAIQAQSYSNLIISNKSGCNAKIDYTDCSSGHFQVVAPAYTTLSPIALSSPPATFDGSYTGVTYQFGGAFAICSSPSIYTNPNSCYTQHVSTSLVTSGSTTNFYISFY